MPSTTRERWELPAERTASLLQTSQALKTGEVSWLTLYEVVGMLGIPQVVKLDAALANVLRVDDRPFELAVHVDLVSHLADDAHVDLDLAILLDDRRVNGSAGVDRPALLEQKNQRLYAGLLNVSHRSPVHAAIERDQVQVLILAGGFAQFQPWPVAMFCDIRDRKLSGSKASF